MENIIREFEKTEKELSVIFSKFSAAETNKSTSPQSWTAAQVAEHIIKSQSNFPQLMKGHSFPTKRDPEEKREKIRKMFLDFSTKMRSPDFILPAEEDHDKMLVLDQIEGKRSEISGALKSADLSRTYSDFELPGFGPFTGYEWGWFIIYHTQRHIHQLKNLAKELGIAD